MTAPYEPCCDDVRRSCRRPTGPLCTPRDAPSADLPEEPIHESAIVYPEPRRTDPTSGRSIFYVLDGQFHDHPWIKVGGWAESGPSNVCGCGCYSWENVVADVGTGFRISTARYAPIGAMTELPGRDE